MQGGNIGSSAVALQATTPAGDELRIYFGQPGILGDVTKIETGQNLDYHWWRIATPMDRIQDGHAHFNLAQVAEVSFWEYFRYAPGCQTNLPWLGKWRAGDDGVTGSIDISRGLNGYDVAFDFVYKGAAVTPCGNPQGTIASSNRFAAEVHQ